MFQSAEVENT